MSLGQSCRVGATTYTSIRPLSGPPPDPAPLVDEFVGCDALEEHSNENVSENTKQGTKVALNSNAISNASVFATR